MARMRSIKPEFWADEDLSVLSRDTRFLYVGLWNLADEHGRLRGDPRYVKGQIFPYDDDLTPGMIDGFLDSLWRAGKVIRYRSGNSTYLFLPNLARHQRLDSDKVESRLPPPPDTPDVPPPEPPQTTADLPRHTQSGNGANESGKNPDESELARARLLSMEHVAGGMEHVAGIPPSADALCAPRESDPDEPPTAQTILGEYLERCRRRPPKQVIGQVAKQVKSMLAEGIDPNDIRRGLAAWMTKGLHPSNLPSVVNEVMNGARASPGNVVAMRNHRPSTTDQRVAAVLALASEFPQAEGGPA